MRQVMLHKYQCKNYGLIFYGYPFSEAMEKTIDGVVYVEVTPSLTRPKSVWVVKDSLDFVGKEFINVNH